VTIVVRSDTLAASMSQYLRDEIGSVPNINVRVSTRVVDGGGERRLESLTLCNGDGTITTEPADALFVLIGARPHTDWLPAEIVRDAHGFVATGSDLGPATWQLSRSPLAFETSLPGVFAVGDLRSRSVKRVAAAVGDGSVVIQQVHQYFQGRPEALAST
jgi:thioredoxin reductase (NADPH)